MHAAVAEHMGNEAEGLEDSGEGRIANAEAASIGAESRHHRAGAVSCKAAALDGTAARRDPGLRMQMAGDLAMGAGRLVAERDGDDGDFIGNAAAEIRREVRIVVAGDPDPVAARLQRREHLAIGGRKATMRGAIVETVAKREDGSIRLLVAARIGKTRLIDNIAVRATSSPSAGP